MIYNHGTTSIPQVVKAIKSKKLREPFRPIQAIKACRPKNPGAFRKIFASHIRGNPFGNQPLFIQLKDGTYETISFKMIKSTLLEEDLKLSVKIMLKMM